MATRGSAYNAPRGVAPANPAKLVVVARAPTTAAPIAAAFQREELFKGSPPGVVAMSWMLRRLAILGCQSEQI
jgi:hypothetical protein